MDSVCTCVVAVSLMCWVDDCDDDDEERVREALLWQLASTSHDSPTILGGEITKKGQVTSGRHESAYICINFIGYRSYHFSL